MLHRKAWIVLLFVGVLLMTGCNGVVLNSEYSSLLDRTAALSAETAKRASDGDLTEGQMTNALMAQAEVWQKFRDGRDGVKVNR